MLTWTDGAIISTFSFIVSTSVWAWFMPLNMLQNTLGCRGNDWLSLCLPSQSALGALGVCVCPFGFRCRWGGRESCHLAEATIQEKRRWRHHHHHYHHHHRHPTSICMAKSPLMRVSLRREGSGWVGGVCVQADVPQCHSTSWNEWITQQMFNVRARLSRQPNAPACSTHGNLLPLNTSGRWVLWRGQDRAFHLNVTLTTEMDRVIFTQLEVPETSWDTVSEILPFEKVGSAARDRYWNREDTCVGYRMRLHNVSTTVQSQWMGADVFFVFLFVYLDFLTAVQKMLGSLIATTLSVMLWLYLVFLLVFSFYCGLFYVSVMIFCQYIAQYGQPASVLVLLVWCNFYHPASVCCSFTSAFFCPFFSGEDCISIGQRSTIKKVYFFQRWL